MAAPMREDALDHVVVDARLGRRDIASQPITDLSSPGARSLIVRFNPAARGALLEVLGSDEHTRDRRGLAPKLR